jgi:hypothetical protein
MADSQVIPNNTWTKVHGTDVQVLIASGSSTPVELQAWREDGGGECLIFSWVSDGAGTVAVRTPRGGDET